MSLAVAKANLIFYTSKYCVEEMYHMALREISYIVYFEQGKVSTSFKK